MYENIPAVQATHTMTGTTTARTFGSALHATRPLDTENYPGGVEVIRDRVNDLIWLTVTNDDGDPHKPVHERRTSLGVSLRPGQWEALTKATTPGQEENNGAVPGDAKIVMGLIDLLITQTITVAQEHGTGDTPVTTALTNLEIGDELSLIEDHAGLTDRYDPMGEFWQFAAAYMETRVSAHLDPYNTTTTNPSN